MADTEKLIPAARHEHTDIGEGFVWAGAALMLGLLVVCALLTRWLYPQSLSDATITSPLPEYPAPRLQSDPGADMRAFHALEMRQLESTGWVDEGHGVVHIPIADAMRIVAHEGIPGWPAPGAPP
jgi:hypothetical protein